jgi:cysteinyl-tRNA synthetase
VVIRSAVLVTTLAGLMALGGANGAFAGRAAIRDVKRWAYQIQGTPRRLDDGVDCLVVDSDNEGHVRAPQEVQQLKQRRGRPRLVVAYLSIGEAEDYRYYWKESWSRHRPAFLAAENPAWRGDFKVRYWQAEWQRIVIDYLDKIIDAGFDGVYLDVIDAFEHFAPDGPRPERRSAAVDMSRFVLRLAQHARMERGKPDFLIIPQNGSMLVETLSSADPRAYFDGIDAIGAEDTFFFGSRAENNPFAPQEETLAALKQFRDAGKPVLSVEYVSEGAKVRKYLAIAHAHGFVPFIAPRSLDRMIEWTN